MKLGGRGWWGGVGGVGGSGSASRGRPKGSPGHLKLLLQTHTVQTTRSTMTNLYGISYCAGTIWQRWCGSWMFDREAEEEGMLTHCAFCLVLLLFCLVCLVQICDGPFHCWRGVNVLPTAVKGCFLCNTHVKTSLSIWLLGETEHRNVLGILLCPQNIRTFGSLFVKWLQFWIEATHGP